MVTLGAALAVIVLLIAQSLAGSGLLGTKTVTVTETATDLSYEQVASAYASHLASLNSRNIPALTSGYERNGTIEWVGAVTGLTGNYSGAGNIEILLGSFVGKFINFSLSNEYQSIGVEGKVSMVNSTFDFRGYSSVVGNVNGTVVAQDTYEHVGSSWLVARETWNFTQFYEQTPLF